MKGTSHKTCSMCKGEKFLEEFSPQKNGPNGHKSQCKTCCNKAAKKRYSEDPNAAKKATAQSKKFRRNNPDYDKQYYYHNRETILVNKKRCDNKYPERRRAYAKQYQQANLALFAYHAAQRRASVHRATPPQYKDKIKEIYKNCPTGYHVDHIVPLRGSSVSGLHVPWNLQYLTAKENLHKSNKLLIGEKV